MATPKWREMLDEAERLHTEKTTCPTCERRIYDEPHWSFLVGTLAFVALALFGLGFSFGTSVGVKAIQASAATK